MITKDAGPPGLISCEGLFSAIGPLGTTFLRLGFAAIMLLLLWRPQVRGLRRAQYSNVLLFGIVLAAMNGAFYSAIRFIERARENPRHSCLILRLWCNFREKSVSSSKLSSMSWLKRMIYSSLSLDLQPRITEIAPEPILTHILQTDILKEPGKPTRVREVA